MLHNQIYRSMEKKGSLEYLEQKSWSKTYKYDYPEMRKLY